MVPPRARPRIAPIRPFQAERPHDPFVVIAGDRIDPRFVVAAPVGIDDRMVVSPDALSGKR